jgi:hypothetical protein
MIGSLAFDGAAGNASRSLIRNRSQLKREACRGARDLDASSLSVCRVADIRAGIGPTAKPVAAGRLLRPGQTIVQVPTRQMLPVASSAIAKRPLGPLRIRSTLPASLLLPFCTPAGVCVRPVVTLLGRGRRITLASKPVQFTHERPSVVLHV